MISCNSLALKFSETKFEILDQTLLPHQEKWIVIESTEQMIEAIKMLRVRGAPLIGVAAALQVAQAALQGFTKTELLKKAQDLYEARPTAVNLMNCIDRMKTVIESGADKNQILKAAVEIFEEDVKLCDRIASHGADLIKDGDQILTHCNTGGLATVGVGTALGVILKAHQQGKKIHVWVDETRPLTQGGRLTTWELHKHKIPFTLIADNMAAHLMSLGKINKAFVGSDRIAQNGDFANKIGTYSVAVNCKFHNIPFYVAAPFTTVDFDCVSGKDIPIEQRAATEVISTWALKEANVYNPSFDVTPAALTTGWIMDTGVFTQKDIEQGIFKRR
ncbi:S-methyl-5-thioribose-1-phosphate isomerase [Bdellovibrio sp. qaytius]|nr:S-methyl-5-thioribose-1-phosphate isomerase [Bdellovibrio sp. qaytius]